MDTCGTQLRVLLKGGRCHFGTFPHEHPSESFRSLLGVTPVFSSLLETDGFPWLES